MRNPHRINGIYFRTLMVIIKLYEKAKISEETYMYIKENCEDIYTIWGDYPDLRLAQLLFNETRDDLFDMYYNHEDENFLKKITELVEG